MIVLYVQVREIIVLFQSYYSDSLVVSVRGSTPLKSLDFDIISRGVIFPTGLPGNPGFFPRRFLTM